MINLVGELVITQAMLKEGSSGLDPVAYETLISGLEELERNTRDLQDSVMSVRMLPMQFAFQRFPRLVRDLAGKMGKEIRLETTGEATELDKSVIEKIVDPLNHIVRNSVDHGIEMPDEREAAGKDRVGTLNLTAMHEGGHIVIRITDDGKGLNREKILAKARERGESVSDELSDNEVWQLICSPGFSTADEVTDVSGRGVGMDVVKRNLVSLGGHLEIDSTPGQGSQITIRLPLTLAILDGMLVRVANETYILPLNYVVESLQPTDDLIKTVSGESRLLKMRDEYIPLLSMRELFGAPTDKSSEASLLVLVESEGRKLALEVDDLLGQQQVVIKSLEANYRKVDGISGATILGDGRVSLIVDVPGLRAPSQRAA